MLKNLLISCRLKGLLLAALDELMKVLVILLLLLPPGDDVERQILQVRYCLSRCTKEDDIKADDDDIMEAGPNMPNNEHYFEKGSSFLVMTEHVVVVSPSQLASSNSCQNINRRYFVYH